MSNDVKDVLIWIGSTTVMLIGANSTPLNLMLFIPAMMVATAQFFWINLEAWKGEK